MMMKMIVVVLVYTCSTVCSCTIKRHGFILDFVVHRFESEGKKEIILDGVVITMYLILLILISQYTDNGHFLIPPLHQQLNSSTRRFNTSKFYFVLILFDRFDTLQFDLIQYD